MRVEEGHRRRHVLLFLCAASAIFCPRSIAEKNSSQTARRQCSTRRMSQSINGTCELEGGPEGPLLSKCLSAEFGGKLPPRHDALRGTPVLATEASDVDGMYGCGATNKILGACRKPKACILVVRRGGGCSFTDKATTAAAMGASGLLVINHDNSLSPMGGVRTGGSISGLVVVMVGQDDGEDIIKAAIHADDSPTSRSLVISSPREAEMLEHGQQLPREHRIASWRSFAARHLWWRLPILRRNLLSRSSNSDRIPKVIIQTWKKPLDQLPSDFARMSATVKRLHPPSLGWKYLYFDDKQVAEFVRTKFPNLWPTFVAFPYDIQRVDFFRLLAVSHYGGFYLDLDMELTQPLDGLRNRSAVFPFELASGENMAGEQIGQYAFGALPGHPFIGAIIENIVSPRFDTKGMTMDKHVLYTTGPVVVTQTLRDCQSGGIKEDLQLHDSVDVLRPSEARQDDISVPDKDTWFRFGSYGQHRMASSWHKQVVGSRLSENEFICAEEGSDASLLSIEEGEP